MEHRHYTTDRDGNTVAHVSYTGGIGSPNASRSSPVTARGRTRQQANDRLNEKLKQLRDAQAHLEAVSSQ